MSMLDDLAEEMGFAIDKDGELRDTPDKAFCQGVRHGYLAAVDMLKSDQARTYSRIHFHIGPVDWSAWLEKEVGENRPTPTDSKGSK